MRQQKDKMKVGDKVGHEELYSLLVSRELSWQQIIYDLISSEQLDPWNIDLIKLTQRYVEKIKELEEASFFISSKVLLAAAILLRIKSELLIDRYIKSLDEILFGKEEKKEKPPIEINLDDVAELFPKTPLPRQRKVTLPELMSALNKAMTTEHRRIKKEIAVRHAITRFDHLIPKKSINIRFKIKEIYQKIKAFFSKNKIEKMAFTQLSSSKEEKLATFSPLLHLDNQERILLQQLKHFDEIYIYMKNGAASAEEVAKEFVKREEEYVKEKTDEAIATKVKETIDKLDEEEKAEEKEDEELKSSIIFKKEGENKS